MSSRNLRSFSRDFRDFLNRGNVVDLAVAVILGGAFAKVVDAVVSILLGSLLNPAMKAAGVDSIAQWPAGALLVALINFLVISFVVYLIVRAIERLKRQEAAVETAADPQLLLAEAAQRLSEALDRRAL